MVSPDLRHCAQGIHAAIKSESGLHCRDCGKQLLGEPPPDREREARARLGSWLAAEPGRTWEYYPDENKVRVCSGMQTWPGSGPTLADAIINALERTQQ